MRKDAVLKTMLDFSLWRRRRTHEEMTGYISNQVIETGGRMPP